MGSSVVEMFGDMTHYGAHTVAACYIRTYNAHVYILHHFILACRRLLLSLPTSFISLRLHLTHQLVLGCLVGTFISASSNLASTLISDTMSMLETSAYWHETLGESTDVL